MSKKIIAFFITWSIVLFLNQIVLFYGCLKMHCLIAALPHTGIIAYLYVAFIWKPEEEELKTNEPNTEEEQSRTKSYKNDPLKQKGDAYEKFIGKKLEDKGEFVIYNGLIRGYEDRGVDIITLETEQKVVNLIQCKNWNKMKMELEHIQDIYKKLSLYTLDIEELDQQSINTHLQKKRSKEEVEETLKDAKHYPTTRKTLYVASENVINPEIGKYLKMIKPNIFRYEDMKIVFVKL